MGVHESKLGNQEEWWTNAEVYVYDLYWMTIYMCKSNNIFKTHFKTPHIQIDRNTVKNV